MAASAPIGRPLRLLIVTPRYFPLIGGVENHVYQIARRLAAAGTAVTVLTADRTGELPPAEVIEGVTVRRVRAWPASQDYYWTPAIWSIIRREPWDIVHVQPYHTLMPPLAMLAARSARIPYVITFHGGGHTLAWRNAVRGLQRRLLQPLFAGAARLIATARFEYELFGDQLGIPRDRFAYIPNGCDLPALPTAARPPSECSVIASVGRLERYKGHHLILAAMPEILRVRPDIRLWIAGSGPYEPELRQQAARLGVADRVEIRAIPASQREEMATALAQTALVTLLSEYETHPMAVLEALALGRPALVAATSGLQELADSGLARAIPLTSTPAEVAAAALGQLRHPLVPAALSLPSWDDCAASLLALYHTIAPPAGPSRSHGHSNPWSVDRRSSQTLTRETPLDRVR